MPVSCLALAAVLRDPPTAMKGVHAMPSTWDVIREKLLTAAGKLKKNKVFDIAVEQLLDEIPIVGGFASKYWSTLGGDDAEKALVGQPLNEQTATLAGEAAVKAAQPLSRNGYKVQITKTAVKRAVMRAAGLRTV